MDHFLALIDPKGRKYLCNQVFIRLALIYTVI